MNKKLLLLLLFFTCSLHTIGQTDYYYSSGKKFPLTLNENKVVVSIPKECGEIIERFHANVQTLCMIKDETFDTHVILRSEYEKLTSLDFWTEDSKSVILTSCYYTDTEGDEEVFATPYLDLRLKKEEDIDLLNQQEEPATIEIQNVEIEDGDTTATVSMNVMNYLCMDTIGKAGHMVENGEFKIMLVFKNKQWRVRMEGLPQNEKMNHD